LRLDLYGKNLVFAWQTSVSRCPGPSGGDGYGPIIATRVYLQRGNQPRKLLEKGCGDTTTFGATAGADAVSVSAGVVNWVRVVQTSSPESAIYLRRRSLRTGRSTDTALPSHYLSLAADGRTVYAHDPSHRIVAVRVEP
jgi:hypothetical protein